MANAELLLSQISRQQNLSQPNDYSWLEMTRFVVGELLLLCGVALVVDFSPAKSFSDECLSMARNDKDHAGGILTLDKSWCGVTR